MTCSSALDGGRSYHAWAKTEKHLYLHVSITLNLSILHQSWSSSTSIDEHC